MADTLRTIGRYELLHPVGIGGMAIVYLARQTDLDRLVAVKELRDFEDADPGLADRFIRESRLSGRLAHQNIVVVHDYCQHDGIPYIVMEYLRQGSLRPLMRALSTAQIAGALEGMLSALAYAEGEGVVHRDLKPENVLVTDDGRVKIADFGVAKHRASTTTQFRTKPGEAIGTPTYMSPEQARADTDAIGPRSDLYAVGVMAYEMLLGRPPFEADTAYGMIWKHVSDPIPPPLELRPDLDPAIAAWLERMLQKSPADRPAGADVAWRQLEDALADELDRTWRREAPLLPASSAAEPPRPLTPAPFSEVRPVAPRPPSEPDRPVPQREDGFRTFAPGGVRHAPPPPTEPAPAAPAGAAEPAAPAATRPRRAPAPDPGIDELATVFPAPAPAREPAAVVTPPAPAEAEAVPVEPDAPAPDPLAPVEGDLAATVAPRTVEPVLEPRTTRRRSAFPVVLVAVLAAAAALGVLLGGSGDEPATTVRTAGLQATLPPGWAPAARAAALPGLPLRDARGFERRSGAGEIVLGRADRSAANPNLVPATFLDRAGAPARDPVDLGAVQAHRYAGARLDGQPAVVYAVPTSGDVAVLACLGLAEIAADCRAIAATLRVTGGRALPVGPSRAHAAALTRIVGRLARDVQGSRRGLGASSSRAQAAAGAALGRDFGQAADAVAALRPGPADRPPTAAFADALRAGARAYRQLTARAKTRDAPGYRRAAAVAERRERRVRDALAEFGAAGYEVEQ